MERKFDVPFSSENPAVRAIDVFLPGENANGCCIFFVHGGGWSGGDKKAWHGVMEHFCELGYVCSSANYHLSPDHKYPRQVEDVRLAMSFMKARAQEYGFDPGRVAVFGSSSGGHLAAMLATIRADEQLGMTDEVAVRDTRPAAGVYLCTVFSVHDDPDRLVRAREAFLGATEREDPALISAASPIDRVRAGDPPCIMIVGDADDTTPVAMHEDMRDALAARGVPVELVVLPGVDHGYGYGVGTPAQKEMLAHVERFLAKTFEPS